MPFLSFLLGIKHLGHFLDNDPLDDPVLNIRDHLLEPKAVKGGAGNAVVNIETDIFPVMVKGVLL